MAVFKNTGEKNTSFGTCLAARQGLESEAGAGREFGEDP